MFLDDIVFVPLNQEGLFATIDAEDAGRVLPLRWTVVRKRSGLYAIHALRRRNIYLHRFILPAIDGAIDHVNHCGLDNRKSNLRPATNAQNLHNRGPQRNNRSGFKGVSFNTRLRKWNSQIVVNGESHWLGLYDTPEEAACAYDKFASALHGDFARLNFPDD